MITQIRVGNGAPVKSYRTLDEKVRKKRAEENWNIIQINGKDHDVQESMLYVASKILKDDWWEQTARDIDEEALLRLADALQNRNEITVSVNSGRQSKANTKQDNGSIDGWITPMLLNHGEFTHILGQYDYVFTSGKIRNEVHTASSYVSLCTINSKLCDVLTVTTVHLLVIYYWLVRNTDLFAVTTLLYNMGLTNRRKELTIKDNETFEEFIGRLYNKQEVELILKYLDDYTMENPYVSFYKHYDEFIKLILEKEKTNSTVENVLKSAEQFLESDEIPPGLKSIIGIQRKRYHRALMVANALIIPLCSHTFAYEPLIAYEAIIASKKAEDSEKQNYRLSTLTYILRLNGLMMFSDRQKSMVELLGLALTRISNNLEKLRENEARLQEDINNQRTKYNTLKQKLSASQKEARALKRELESERHRGDKLESQNKTGLTPEECERLQKSNGKLNKELKEAKGKLLNMERQLSKKDRDIESLEDKLSESEEKYNEMAERHSRIQDTVNKMEVHRAYNQIPVSCFVNCIREKRIALIGGDMMFPKLQDYGLDNMRFYKAGCKELSYEDISDIDLIVIATAFVDHSSTEYVVRASKNHKIPMIKFNNKNADMLIYTIFEEFNKQ